MRPAIDYPLLPIAFRIHAYTLAYMAQYRGTVKGWFLTYPQNSASKEFLMDKLKSLGEEIIVCEEKHADGSPHLHAFIKLNAPVNKRDSLNIFNLLDKTGNYQPARSWKSCADYIKKDGNYLTHNCDVESAQQKKRKRNEELLSKPIHELVDDGLISLQLAPQIKKAKLCYEESKNNRFEIDITQKRGLWIYGPPGVGKSYKVRREYTDLYIKAQNKWWDGYTGQKAVLIDDFDKQGACLSHYLKIWADIYFSTGEVKGGMVNLNYNKIIITSNYQPSEIFEGDSVLLEALLRRFDLLFVDVPLVFSNNPISDTQHNFLT